MFDCSFLFGNEPSLNTEETLFDINSQIQIDSLQNSIVNPYNELL